MNASEKYIKVENLENTTNAAGSMLNSLKDFGLSGHSVTVTKRTRTVRGIR